MRLKATSFATRQDLAAFALAIMHGKTSREEPHSLCTLREGIGLCDSCSQPKHPQEYQGYGFMVCLDCIAAERKAANVALARSIAKHNQIVSVKLEGAGHGQEFDAVVRDIAPAGIVDLNPAALIAAGLAPDTELNTTALVTLRATDSA